MTKRRNNEQITIQFILDRVDISRGSNCWVWRKSCMSNGYPAIGLNYKVLCGQRVVWEIKNGKIPIGMMVCHKCDNRKCLNPDHLFLGTARDNSIDALNKSRLKHVVASGEMHGNSKLNWKDIKEIRSSSEPSRKIAKRLGISKSTVLRIRRNEAWNKPDSFSIIQCLH